MYDHKSIFFLKKTNGKGWHISLKENKQALHSAENCFSRALICGGAWKQHS
jgi:hypothetical protein